MGIVLFVIPKVVYRIYVKMKQPGPEGKFQGKGRVIKWRPAYQIYARAAPKPPGARLCNRRMSQSGESPNDVFSRDFSDWVVIC